MADLQKKEKNLEEQRQVAIDTEKMKFMEKHHISLEHLMLLNQVSEQEIRQLLKQKEEQELLEEMEKEESQNNGKKVDYIITHEAPASVKRLIKRDSTINDLNIFFDTILHNVRYKKWFFGSLHTDRELSIKMTCVWQEVIKIV